MIKTPTGKPQTRRDVLELEIGQLVEYLYRRQPRGEQVQHVRHADAQPSHTWTPPALLWVYSDPIGQYSHGSSSETEYTLARPERICN
jgi:hypothetical protein